MRDSRSWRLASSRTLHGHRRRTASPRSTRGWPVSASSTRSTSSRQTTLPGRGGPRRATDRRSCDGLGRLGLGRRRPRARRRHAHPHGPRGRRRRAPRALPARHRLGPRDRRTAPGRPDAAHLQHGPDVRRGTMRMASTARCAPAAPTACAAVDGDESRSATAPSVLHTPGHASHHVALHDALTARCSPARRSARTSRTAQLPAGPAAAGGGRRGGDREHRADARPVRPSVAPHLPLRHGPEFRAGVGFKNLAAEQLHVGRDGPDGLTEEPPADEAGSVDRLRASRPDRSTEPDSRGSAVRPGSVRRDRVDPDERAGSRALLSGSDGSAEATSLSEAERAARPRRRRTRRGGRSCGTPPRPRRDAPPSRGCRPGRTTGAACTARRRPRRVFARAMNAERLRDTGPGRRAPTWPRSRPRPSPRSGRPVAKRLLGQGHGLLGPAEPRQAIGDQMVLVDAPGHALVRLELGQRLLPALGPVVARDPGPRGPPPTAAPPPSPCSASVTPRRRRRDRAARSRAPARDDRVVLARARASAGPRRPTRAGASPASRASRATVRCADAATSARSEGREANGPPRRGGPFRNDVSAATYSPTQSPGQYHRRWRA